MLLACKIILFLFMLLVGEKKYGGNIEVVQNINKRVPNIYVSSIQLLADETLLKLIQVCNN